MDDRIEVNQIYTTNDLINFMDTNRKVIFASKNALDFPNLNQYHRDMKFLVYKFDSYFIHKIISANTCVDDFVEIYFINPV